MQLVQNDKCFGRHVSLNHPEGSKFCTICNDFVLVDSWHRCTCCLNKVPRETKSLNAYKRLESLVEQNKIIIDAYLKHPYKCTDMPGFVISIDWRTYLVSIEDIAEFATMPRTRNPMKLKPLVDKIQSKAALIYPGTRIR
jgi:hypothetical protein